MLRLPTRDPAWRTSGPGQSVNGGETEAQKGDGTFRGDTSSKEQVSSHRGGSQPPTKALRARVCAYLPDDPHAPHATTRK